MFKTKSRQVTLSIKCSQSNPIFPDASPQAADAAFVWHASRAGKGGVTSTAPILMKLGQNSVWCLIRSEKNFYAETFGSQIMDLTSGSILTRFLLTKQTSRVFSS
eukprot:sb/3477919/